MDFVLLNTWGERIEIDIGIEIDCLLRWPRYEDFPVYGSPPFPLLKSSCPIEFIPLEFDSLPQLLYQWGVLANHVYLLI